MFEFYCHHFGVTFGSLVSIMSLRGNSYTLNLGGIK